MNRLLLIDDDERLALLLDKYFTRFDLKLDSVTTPSEGFRQLESNDYAMIILDVMLPEMDGFEVCKTIRKSSKVPIIMLTARGDVMDRVVGLELGADDYLPKPFEPRELVARIQSILKRSYADMSDELRLRFGEFVIDLETQEAWISGQTLHLSTTEYQLLEHLVRHRGETQSRDQILNALKGTDAELFTRSVDIAVSRLRQKLKPLELIKTIRSRGYLFVGKQQ